MNDQDTAMTVASEAPQVPMRVGAPDVVNPFASVTGFESALRMAKLLSSSTMVPTHYRGGDNLPNCIVAMEYAYRTGTSIFAVMQHCSIIKGKPSWASTYLIGLINGSGKFRDNLEFEYEGAEGEDEYRCRAYAQSRASGKWLYGGWVSITMAKAEGWYGRDGSKWPNMPTQMLGYRAASFFSRLYCPEITMGMQSEDEVQDAYAEVVVEPASTTSDLADRLKVQVEARQQEAPASEPEKVIEGELVDQGQAPPEAPAPQRNGETFEGTPAEAEETPPTATDAEAAPPTEAPPQDARLPAYKVAERIQAAETVEALDAAMARAAHLPEKAQQRLQDQRDARERKLQGQEAEA